MEPFPRLGTDPGPRFFTVVEHSVDRAGRRRDRKFKPPVFGQIQAAGDSLATNRFHGCGISSSFDGFHPINFTPLRRGVFFVIALAPLWMPDGALSREITVSDCDGPSAPRGGRSRLAKSGAR